MRGGRKRGAPNIQQPAPNPPPPKTGDGVRGGRWIVRKGVRIWVPK